MRAESRRVESMGGAGGYASRKSDGAAGRVNECRSFDVLQLEV